MGKVLICNAEKRGFQWGMVFVDKIKQKFINEILLSV